MEWKVLKSEYLHKEPWLTVRKDKCELPNGNIVPAFYVIEYPDWVNAVCVTEENNILMVRQYRHGLNSVQIEVPGGVAEENETPEQACRREIKEETGYEFDDFEYLGKICANPSTTNNYTHMFLARNGRKVAEQSLDESEEVEVLHLSIPEVKQLIRENRMMQSLHVNTLMYALEKLGELKF